MIRAAILLILSACTYPPLHESAEIRWVPDKLQETGWAHPELQGEWYTPRVVVTGPVEIEPAPRGQR